jgi:hypothetical protein
MGHCRASAASGRHNSQPGLVKSKRPLMAAGLEVGFRRVYAFYRVRSAREPEAIMLLAFLLETDALHQPTEPGQAQQDRSRMAHVGTRSRTSVFTWQLRTVQGSEEAGERSEERHLPSQPMTKGKV